MGSLACVAHGGAETGGPHVLPQIAGASWHEGGDSRTGPQDGQSTLDRRDRADTAPFASTECPRLAPAACGLPSGECPQRRFQMDMRFDSGVLEE
jgi:hypothetical protein